ncbi:MAG TPA: deoxyribodipyrimidine photo-lyase [Opitutaceae bacterium]|nr:deoxyribodipyrimidine photo-lyase [Opitutaceae bacterium]
MESPIKFSNDTFITAKTWPRSLAVKELGLLPSVRWDKEFYQRWQPGEAGAQFRLKKFLKRAADDYADQRNFPGREGTSRLSPHLRFGEISPRQIWAAFQAKSKKSGAFPNSRGAQVFLSEIGWREFAYHLLFHFPHTAAKLLRTEFDRFPWKNDPGALKAWQRGKTGYPIVDAGMRELRATGWMHNRVRMIVGSFLVKNLLIPWQEGAAWFWDTPVDADLAANTLGWQWTAGCGADAAPYFRIFNPFLRGAKFDSEGIYIRRWVPELGRLPAEYLHQPWTAPVDVLNRAGVELGEKLSEADRRSCRSAPCGARRMAVGQEGVEELIRSLERTKLRLRDRPPLKFNRGVGCQSADNCRATRNWRY